MDSKSGNMKQFLILHNLLNHVENYGETSLHNIKSTFQHKLEFWEDLPLKLQIFAKKKL